MNKEGAVCVEKCNLAKSCYDHEVWKTLPSRNSKYDILGADIILLIQDSSLKDIKSGNIISKDTVCAEKCSIAKSCSIF